MTSSPSTPLGRLVTFEGIEGSGKSTQCRRLAAELERRGQAPLATREPGGTALGQELRRLLLTPHATIHPMAELLLYCADRAQHVAEIIGPALRRGQTVLCDRYSDATVAYQGHARKLGTQLVEQVNIGHVEPHLTFLFDLPAEVGLERARRRNAQNQSQEGRFEDEELSFHRAVRAGYLALAARLPRIVVVAAARDPDVVFSEVLAIFEQRQ